MYAPPPRGPAELVYHVTHLWGQGGLGELFERSADVDKVLHHAAHQRVLNPVLQLLQLGGQLSAGTGRADGGQI